jgi:hypothetical protein
MLGRLKKVRMVETQSRADLTSVYTALLPGLDSLECHSSQSWVTVSPTLLLPIATQGRDGSFHTWPPANKTSGQWPWPRLVPRRSVSPTVSSVGVYMQS